MYELSEAETVALFVIPNGCVAFVPTSTVLKFSVPVLSVRVEGLDTPDNETNSSDVAEVDAISMAPARVLWPLPGCGVKLTDTVQLAPAIRVPQLVVAGKSAVLLMPEIAIVALPMLVTVTVCGEDALPTAVSAKLIELGVVASVSAGEVFDGDPTSTGVDVPVRLMRSGAETASLSIVNTPVSVLVGGGLEPAAA